jgi:HK97 family phage portal protein
MAQNFVQKALSSIIGKSVIDNQQPNYNHAGLNLIDSFFSYWLGKGGSFAKYTKAYGENPLVYMVVKRIAFSSASIKRVAVDENGEPLDNSQILNLLASPNESDDEVEFREKINEFLLLTGNAFIRMVRGMGMGVELEVLYTQRMEIVCNKIGEVLYYQYTLPDGTIVRYEIEEILHIKTSNVVNIDGIGYKYGLSPLQSAWVVVASSMEKLKADASIFKSRGIIGILTSDTDTPMLEPERERLQGEFDKETGGADKFNKIKISTSRLRFLQTGMSPTDLQLLDGILSSLRLICGVYGMPSVLFNDNESSTYNNVETAKKTAYTDVYIPLGNKVDKELNKWLNAMLGIEEKIEIDLTSIEVIKASTNEIAQALNNAKESARIVECMTKDEVRELVGLEELPEGAETIGQANANINIGNNGGQEEN